MNILGLEWWGFNVVMWGIDEPYLTLEDDKWPLQPIWQLFHNPSFPGYETFLGIRMALEGGNSESSGMSVVELHSLMLSHEMLVEIWFRAREDGHG